MILIEEELYTGPNSRVTCKSGKREREENES